MRLLLRTFAAAAASTVLFLIEGAPGCPVTHTAPAYISLAGAECLSLAPGGRAALRLSGADLDSIGRVELRDNETPAQGVHLELGPRLASGHQAERELKIYMDPDSQARGLLKLVLHGQNGKLPHPVSAVAASRP